MSASYRSGHLEDDDAHFYHLTQGDRRGYYRLRIVREDGSYFSVLYDDIHTLEGSADGTKLTLCVKGGLLVTLIGERLETLADYLDECRVRKLYIFQPGARTLKDAKGPVILSIVETSQAMWKKAEA
jgi:hypothetical protein